ARLRGSQAGAAGGRWSAVSSFLRPQVTFGQCPGALVPRDARVEFLRPGFDAARDVRDGLETLRLQEHGNAHRARAVVAKDCHRSPRVQLAETARDLVHRYLHQLEAVFGLDARGPHFAGLAHVQDDAAFTRTRAMRLDPCGP